MKRIKSRMTLKEALETMLEMAEDKLSRAINKGKEWDIEHYRNDVEIVKKQLIGL
jgi:ATP-dependent protease HslVU (ClpYQ) peptidase subunit